MRQFFKRLLIFVTLTVVTQSSFVSAAGIRVLGPSGQVLDAPEYNLPENSDPSKFYGPTTANETLWSIASKIRPSNQVTVQQTLLAIFELNPSAFENQNIHGLIPGSTIRIPSIDQIRSVTTQQAIDVMNVHQVRLGAETATARAPATVNNAAPTNTNSAPEPQRQPEAPTPKEAVTPANTTESDSPSSLQSKLAEMTKPNVAAITELNETDKQELLALEEKNHRLMLMLSKVQSEVENLKTNLDDEARIRTEVEKLLIEEKRKNEEAAKLAPSTFDKLISKWWFIAAVGLIPGALIAYLITLFIRKRGDSVEEPASEQELQPESLNVGETPAEAIDDLMLDDDLFSVEDGDELDDDFNTDDVFAEFEDDNSNVGLDESDLEDDPFAAVDDDGDFIGVDLDDTLATESSNGISVNADDKALGLEEMEKALDEVANDLGDDFDLSDSDSNDDDSIISQDDIESLLAGGLDGLDDEPEEKGEYANLGLGDAAITSDSDLEDLFNNIDSQPDLDELENSALSEDEYNLDIDDDPKSESVKSDDISLLDELVDAEIDSEEDTDWDKELDELAGFDLSSDDDFDELLSSSLDQQLDDVGSTEEDIKELDDFLDTLDEDDELAEVSSDPELLSDPIDDGTDFLDELIEIEKNAQESELETETETETEPELEPQPLESDEEDSEDFNSNEFLDDLLDSVPDNDPLLDDMDLDGDGADDFDFNPEIEGYTTDNDELEELAEEATEETAEEPVIANEFGIPQDDDWDLEEDITEPEPDTLDSEQEDIQVEDIEAFDEPVEVSEVEMPQEIESDEQEIVDDTDSEVAESQPAPEEQPVSEEAEVAQPITELTPADDELFEELVALADSEFPADEEQTPSETLELSDEEQAVSAIDEELFNEFVDLAEPEAVSPDEDELITNSDMMESESSESANGLSDDALPDITQDSDVQEPQHTIADDELLDELVAIAEPVSESVTDSLAENEPTLDEIEPETVEPAPLEETVEPEPVELSDDELPEFSEDDLLAEAEVEAPQEAIEPAVEEAADLPVEEELVLDEIEPETVEPAPLEETVEAEPVELSDDELPEFSEDDLLAQAEFEAPQEQIEPAVEEAADIEIEDEPVLDVIEPETVEPAPLEETVEPEPVELSDDELPEFSEDDLLAEAEVEVPQEAAEAAVEEAADIEVEDEAVLDEIEPETVQPAPLEEIAEPEPVELSDDELPELSEDDLLAQAEFEAPQEPIEPAVEEAADIEVEDEPVLDEIEPEIVEPAPLEEAVEPEPVELSDDELPELSEDDLLAQAVFEAPQESVEPTAEEAAEAEVEEVANLPVEEESVLDEIEPEIVEPALLEEAVEHEPVELSDDELPEFSEDDLLAETEFEAPQEPIEPAVEEVAELADENELALDAIEPETVEPAPLEEAVEPEPVELSDDELPEFSEDDLLSETEFEAPQELVEPTAEESAEAEVEEVADLPVEEESVLDEIEPETVEPAPLEEAVEPEPVELSDDELPEFSEDDLLADTEFEAPQEPVEPELEESVELPVEDEITLEDIEPERSESEPFEEELESESVELSDAELPEFNEEDALAEADLDAPGLAEEMLPPADQHHERFEFDDTDLPSFDEEELLSSSGETSTDYDDDLHDISRAAFDESALEELLSEDDSGEHYTLSDHILDDDFVDSNGMNIDTMLEDLDGEDWNGFKLSPEQQSKLSIDIPDDEQDIWRDDIQTAEPEIADENWAVQESIVDDDPKEKRYMTIDELMAQVDAEGGEFDEQDLKLDVGLNEFPDVIGNISDIDVDSNAEASGKLDLAKIYMEMNDDQGAIKLLEEAIVDGDDNIRRQAKHLIDQINGNG